MEKQEIISELYYLLEREKITSQLQMFFSVRELVCKHTYARFGDASWQFFDTEWLHALLVIRRDILKVPMSCNYGTYDQRGLRCNMCEMVKGKNKAYLSAHVLGKGGDFTCKGMTSEQARKMIVANADLLPCAIRLEKDVNWLHMDTLHQFGITEKVYLFKV